jgi:hypothetical protein
MDITQQAFDKLCQTRTVIEIEKFLETLDIADSSSNPSGHIYKWRPVNDTLSNASNIENAQHSISPIIERITNAFDANLELISKQNPSQQLPQSPRKAIERWMRIPQGDMGLYGANLQKQNKRAEREHLASGCKVEFYDSGIERRPTIIIRDNGIGQHPSDFATTLLKLGDSNKISLPYLHGTYGHGGSSSFRFCKYSIIASRRQIIALDNKPDIVGWTIVRKNDALEVYSEKEQKVVSIKKPPVYEYLTLNNGVVPSIQINTFNYGTLVAHIEYDAMGWYNLSRGKGYQLFRNFLFDPILPFRLEDKRLNIDFNRNIFGARSTLLESDDVAYSNEIEEYMPDGGKLKIRYFVLYNPLDPSNRPLENYLERENSRNTIILTMNGQRHGSMEKTIIAKGLRLSNLSQCLLVQIEIDDLTRGMKASLFTSNRETIVHDQEV